MFRFFKRKSAPVRAASPEPAQPSNQESPTSLAALRSGRREAWRAGIFVVITMFLAMLILLAGGYWIVNR